MRDKALWLNKVFLAGLRVKAETVRICSYGNGHTITAYLQNGTNHRYIAAVSRLKNGLRESTL